MSSPLISPVTRRGFIAALIGTPAVLALFPNIGAAAESPILVAPSQWPSIYAKAHDRAFWQFQREMQTRRGVVVRDTGYPSVRVGDTLPSGARVARQYGVSMTDGDLEHSSLEAAMAALAESAGVDEFAAMTLPASTTYAAMRGPLRMIVVYDVGLDAHMVRFDVLGGTSPAYRQRLERERIAALKRQIRARLQRPGRSVAWPE